MSDERKRLNESDSRKDAAYELRGGHHDLDDFYGNDEFDEEFGVRDSSHHH